MAVYKIFPSADATLYSDSTSQNTGLDEIIEFSTFNSTPLYSYTPQVSRALIQFSNSDLWLSIKSIAFTIFDTSIKPKQPFEIAIFNASLIICFDVLLSIIKKVKVCLLGMLVD